MRNQSMPRELVKDSCRLWPSTAGGFLRVLLISALSLLCFCSSSKPDGEFDRSLTTKKIRLVADSILANTTFSFVDKKTNIRYFSTEVPESIQLVPTSPYNDWRYWNGVLNLAMLKVGDVLDDSSYSNFADRCIAFDFDNCKYFEDKFHGEDKWSYPFGQKIVMQELDDYGAMGASLIEVYTHDRQPRYHAYLDSAANYITTRQSRLADGTLVRSFPRKWTLWADDLYMSVSFLSRLGELTHDKKYFDDAAAQVINFHKYLYDAEKGLMYHCWFSDTKKNGVAFWGRANGWALLAQITLLDRLPKEYPERDTLLSIFKQHVAGIVKYQSSDGLWHQLLDKPDSYLETSCSAMFTYAIARGVDAGYLELGYVFFAERGWKGVMSKIGSDGQVEGVCTGTGVGDDLAFYYDRPTPLNDVHGIGTVLLAGAEMLHLEK
jgi:unsaturated rhamnogalacturonyl hydrolase